MKKKGFTLIELLAVIVILAIIALIATPLVLKYIEKSKQESKVDSAYSFVRNLETEIANFSIKNNGKKYNGQPNDKGYYELSSFKDSEIDTTVKGDKPNSIKVCLSSLGQVEKAMFEYGKYYVSYDGKKGSISDKDTYDNFSCSGNVSGGGSNNVGDGDDSKSVLIVEDVELTLTLNPDIGISLSEPVDIDTSMMELPSNYKLTLVAEDGSVIEEQYFVYYWEDDGQVSIMTDIREQKFAFGIEDGKFAIANYEGVDGTYIVKLEKVASLPYGVAVQNNGAVFINFISDFCFQDSTSVTVKFIDENNNVFGTIEESLVKYIQCDGTKPHHLNIGIHDIGVFTFGDEIYNEIGQGKKFSIEIYNGNDLIYTIPYAGNELRKDQYNTYRWGNYYMGLN